MQIYIDALLNLGYGSTACLFWKKHILGVLDPVVKTNSPYSSSMDMSAGEGMATPQVDGSPKGMLQTAAQVQSQVESFGI